MINLKNVHEALMFAQVHNFKKPCLRLRRDVYDQLYAECKAIYSPANFVLPSWPYRNVEIYGMRVYIVDEQVGDAMITEEGESWMVYVNENGAPEYLETA